MYVDGNGVPQVYKLAQSYFELAARQGSALAQFNLGEMYQTGIGVLADNVLAQMWFNLSGANGDSNGAKKREKIAKDMTPEDISKAQTMARVCMNSNYEKCGY